MANLYKRRVIRYTKDNETTTRTIIPTKLPSHIKAVDVSNLSDDEIAKYEEMLKSYYDYVSQYMKNVFSFEDWSEMTTGERLEPKWRTFKEKQTEFID